MAIPMGAEGLSLETHRCTPPHRNRGKPQCCNRRCNAETASSKTRLHAESFAAQCGLGSRIWVLMTRAIVRR